MSSLRLVAHVLTQTDRMLLCNRNWSYSGDPNWNGVHHYRNVHNNAVTPKIIEDGQNWRKNTIITNYQQNGTNCAPPKTSLFIPQLFLKPNPANYHVWLRLRTKYAAKGTTNQTEWYAEKKAEMDGIVLLALLILYLSECEMWSTDPLDKAVLYLIHERHVLHGLQILPFKFRSLGQPDAGSADRRCEGIFQSLSLESMPVITRSSRFSVPARWIIPSATTCKSCIAKSGYESNYAI